MENDPVAERFSSIAWALDERLRRIVAASEAKAMGRGGIASVSRSTGVSRRAIHVGLRELEDHPEDMAPRRIRRSGAGRKKITETDPTLMIDLESLVEPVTRGDPISPLRFTTKSLRQLSEELGTMGHVVSHTSVGILLQELGYSLQSNAKTLEGGKHPDRNAQFAYINAETNTKSVSFPSAQ